MCGAWTVQVVSTWTVFVFLTAAIATVSMTLFSCIASQCPHEHGASDGSHDARGNGTKIAPSWRTTRRPLKAVTIPTPAHTA